jgi:sugar phosphate isomerase/epimerase
LDKVLAFYAGRGIHITSTGLFHVGPDEAKSRKAFEFARLAGVKAFTTDIDSGGAETAERLASEYGIRLAVHNHGRRHRHGPAWALEDLLARTSPAVGLCLDTAWAIDSGDDPVKLVRKFASRLYGVHVKDFVFDRAGKPSDVIVGQGNLNLDEFLKALVEVRFDGYFTLEYEGDVNDPVLATRKCVEAIRESLGRLESKG